MTAPREILVSLRKGILTTERAPHPPHPLYGTRETIRADVAAYAAAGCDYLVLTLRRAPTADALVTALEEAVAALA